MDAEEPLRPSGILYRFEPVLELSTSEVASIVRHDCLSDSLARKEPPQRTFREGGCCRRRQEDLRKARVGIDRDKGIDAAEEWTAVI